MPGQTAASCVRIDVGERSRRGLLLELGQTIERYTVEALVGQGGMALVYRVRHNQLGSLHALKILTMPRPGIRTRLLQEGRVQAGIRHANVVQVTDVLEIDSAPALLMEYVDGPSLEKWLTKYRPTPIDAQALFRGICEGVEEAHHHGLVHRDLKPANVLLARTRSGFVPKVCDFGLAKYRYVPDGSGTQSRDGMGTPAYMAPEQIREAREVDHLADIFSLGCILYELVCGARPFTGPDVLTVFNKIVGGNYVPPAEMNPEVLPNVAQTIRRCLEVDPADRPQDCYEVLMSLGGGEFPTDPAPRVQTGWKRPRRGSTPTPDSARPVVRARPGHMVPTSLDTLHFTVDGRADTVPNAPERVSTPSTTPVVNWLVPGIVVALVVLSLISAGVAIWGASQGARPEVPVAPATP